jgi:hypothetical protein
MKTCTILLIKFVKTLINLSGQMLDDGVSSLLQKGLNYAVTPCTITIEDILAGVEKAVQSLPVEMAEEARQETVRIIKSFSRPRDNITRAARETLRTLTLRLLMSYIYIYGAPILDVSRSHTTHHSR